MTNAESRLLVAVHGGANTQCPVRKRYERFGGSLAGDIKRFPAAGDIGPHANADNARRRVAASRERPGPRISNLLEEGA